MKLTELFKGAVPLTIHKGPTKWRAETEINGRTLNFQASKNPEGEWYLKFSEDYEVEPGAVVSTYSMTGSGGEIKVMATLKTFVETFFKEMQPEKVRFTADDDSEARANVYLNMLKKWLSDDYHCKVLRGRKTEFTITKV